MARGYWAYVWAAAVGWACAACSLDTRPLPGSYPARTVDSGRPSMGGIGGAGGAGGAGHPIEWPDGGSSPAQDDAGNDLPPGCDVRGVYAVRTHVDVYWGGRSSGLAELVDAGRDHIVIDLMLNVEDYDFTTGRISGDVRICNTELPLFTSTILCEAYGPIFPHELWESSQMPRLPLDGEWRCDDQGCQLSVEPITAQLGIELPDPDGAWPTAGSARQMTCASGSGSDCFPDHDADDKPGITVRMRTSGGVSSCRNLFGQTGPYRVRAPPLSADPSAIVDGVYRAEDLHLGMRAGLGGAVEFARDCTGGKGTGVARYLESRAWGCKVDPHSWVPFIGAAGPNKLCNQDEVDFFDANLPDYFILEPGEVPPSSFDVPDHSPSIGPQLSYVRLGPVGQAASCQQVRDTPHPL